MQRLHCELPNATIRRIPDCGHLPHVERSNSVTKLIVDFVQEDCYEEIECVPNIQVHFQLVQENFGKCKNLSQFAFHLA